MLTDNPVLVVIDAGHVLGDKICKKCNTIWPCDTVKAAREDAGYRARALDMVKWEQKRRDSRRLG